jgi:hypothetical protein
MSSPRMLNLNIESSKSSAKFNAYNFYAKNNNNALLPKPEFGKYRNDVKKYMEMKKKHV